ncbi:A24 family peptidase [Candidatus Viadribacter manganicus]|nr:prepilin peptidase [Candidatus Viadribacter manganicus]
MIALPIFAGLVIYAALSDMARLIIPNWISIALAAIFPIVAMFMGASLLDVGLHIVFGLGVLAVGFVLFQFNIIGGGDAKLLAAVSIWTGLTAFTPFILWTAIAGGLMALTLLTARQLIPAGTYPAFVEHLLKKQNGIPYGVAIMVGALMAIPSLPYLSSPLTLN